MCSEVPKLRGRRSADTGEERLAKKSGSTGSVRRIRLKSRKTKPQNRLGVMLSNPGGGSLIDTKSARPKGKQ